MSLNYAILLGSLGGRYTDVICICWVKIGYPIVCCAVSPVPLALPSHKTALASHRVLSKK